MHLIGINGFKRSGKNTVFELVQDICKADAAKFGNDPEVVRGVGFADKLKVMAAKSLGAEGTDEAMISYMDKFKEDGFITFGYGGRQDGQITGRQFLQFFGGRARDVFGDTFWIDQVLPRGAYTTIPALSHASVEVEAMYPGVDILCITDLRYPNEAERIKAHGGLVWHVVRPGLESDGHDSEQPLPEHLIDWTINNSRDLAHLRCEVADAMSNCGV